MKLQLTSLFITLTLTALAQQTNLGHIDFPTSGSPQAQKHLLFRESCCFTASNMPMRKTSFRRTSKLETRI